MTKVEDELAALRRIGSFGNIHSTKEKELYNSYALQEGYSHPQAQWVSVESDTPQRFVCDTKAVNSSVYINAPVYSSSYSDEFIPVQDISFRIPKADQAFIDSLLGKGAGNFPTKIEGDWLVEEYVPEHRKYKPQKPAEKGRPVRAGKSYSMEKALRADIAVKVAEEKQEKDLNRDYNWIFRLKNE